MKTATQDSIDTARDMACWVVSRPQEHGSAEVRKAVGVVAEFYARCAWMNFDLNATAAPSRRDLDAAADGAAEHLRLTVAVRSEADPDPEVAKNFQSEVRRHFRKWLNG